MEIDEEKLKSILEAIAEYKAESAYDPERKARIINACSEKVPGLRAMIWEWLVSKDGNIENFLQYAPEKEALEAINLAQQSIEIAGDALLDVLINHIGKHAIEKVIIKEKLKRPVFPIPKYPI